MNRMILGLMLVVSTQAFGLDCPKAKLVCTLEKLGDKGAYQLVDSSETVFAGINDDEPSLPANACEARTFFSAEKTGEGVSLNAVVTAEDSTAYLFAYQGTAALEPQFSQRVSPGKPLRINYKSARMTCALWPQ